MTSDQFLFVCSQGSPGIDLLEEDRKFFQYLRDHGWEGTVGEDDTSITAWDSSLVGATVEKDQENSETRE